MYGPAGERRLTELELDWLPGYEGSSPVRIGNGAVEQFQLDVYGEVMDALHESRVAGIEPDPSAWNVQRVLLDFLEGAWDQPDEGIWEIRGPRRHFTHSKVMAWVGIDRAIRGVEELGLEGSLDRWRRVRSDIHSEVCEKGYDPERNAFVQHYDGSRARRLPPHDPARGLPAAARPAGGRAPSTRSSRSSRRTACCSATERTT